jgi:hypothetical protein
MAGMTRHAETDAMLRRFERNQAVACVAMAALSALAGRFDVALGVIGGGLLMAISYRAIKGGVDVIVPAAAASGGDTHSTRTAARRRAWLAARFLGRYALLALAAYVMLARLHTHPAGLLLGAASPVVAMAVEAVRFVRASSRPGGSRHP